MQNGCLFELYNIFGFSVKMNSCFKIKEPNKMFFFTEYRCIITYNVNLLTINPFSAGPEISRGKKCPTVAGPEISECFFDILSVKSMWSGIHGGNLILADKILFLY